MDRVRFSVISCGCFFIIKMYSTDFKLFVFVFFFRKYYYLDERKIMYCQIPKVSGSTWFAVLVNHTEIGKQYTIEELTAKVGFVQKFKKRLKPGKPYDANVHQNYTKFMFVRHPFNRLVSAYKNKADITRHSDVLYIEIKAYFQHNLTREQLKNFIPSFQEFVDFALHYDDKHWRSFQYFCNPCHVNFDYILRLETFERDSKILMKDIFPEAGPVPHANPTQNDTNTFQGIVKPKVLEMLAQLSKETLDKLYEKYAFDLEFYGYSFNRETLEAACGFEKYACC